jgi:hypothetical protein
MLVTRSADGALASAEGPSLLGERSVRIPVSGKLRSGIKVLTKTAAQSDRARAIYERGLAAGISFDAIAAEIEAAGVKSPLTPRNAPWFSARRCDFAMPEIADRLLELYGENRGEGRHLYRLPVVFVTDSWLTNLPHRFACYSAAELRYWSEYGPDGARYCKTRAAIEVDPKTRRARRVWGGRPVVLRPDNDGRCEPNVCPEYQARACTLRGSLLFYVPGIPGTGAIELTTTSFYGLEQARQAMAMVYHLRGGRIAGTIDGRPVFWLTKRQEQISMIDPQTGRPKRVSQWLPHLEADLDMGRVFAAIDRDHVAAGAAAAADLSGEPAGRDADDEPPPIEGEIADGAECETPETHDPPPAPPAPAPTPTPTRADIDAMRRQVRDAARALAIQPDELKAYFGQAVGAGWASTREGLTRTLDVLAQAADEPDLLDDIRNSVVPF